MKRKMVATGSPALAMLVLGALLGGAAVAANAQLMDAPAPAVDAPRTGVAAEDGAGQAKAPAAAGQINGTVLDAQSNVIEEAVVTLASAGFTGIRRTKTDSDGRYHFDGVPAGRFTLTASAPNMTAKSYSDVLHAGEHFGAPAIRLGIASLESAVNVVASQEELAQAEINVEEHQRLAGFMPNFYVSYDWKAAPLSTRQKYSLAWKNTIDPANSIINLGVAGIQQSNNSISGYHQGASGYFKRFGSDEANLAVGTMLGGAVFPALFHQDPRYFYKGTGSVLSRTLYALSTAVISRGDNGKWQPAYASVLGDLAAGAVANIYYPAQNRDGVALTFENGLLDVAYDGLGALVQEFVFRHLTPHAPNYESIAHP